VSERPLHVQVAEALGCKLVPLGNGLACGCHATKPQHGCYGEIFHYDTDWSATGPLIEKYRIEGESCGDSGWIAWYFDSNFDDKTADDDIRGDGETFLIAVCNLILALGVAGKL
jgi:hypothetical protein